MAGPVQEGLIDYKGFIKYYNYLRLEMCVVCNVVRKVLYFYLDIAGQGWDNFLLDLFSNVWLN